MTNPNRPVSIATKNRPRATPKGRHPSDADLKDVRDALAGQPLSRETVIEHLHTLNDRFGHLRAGHIAALGQIMGLAQIDVYETATFYSHFTVIPEGQTPPPAVTLRLCEGPACRMAGAKTLLHEALAAFKDQIQVLAAPCQGACDMPPSAILSKQRIAPANMTTLAARVDAPSPAFVDVSLTAVDPGPQDLAQAIETLERAGLRGLGGAGFPTAKKWAFFKDAPTAQRVLVVNADEGEPGTFKDRYLLENHLDRVLDGMLIAARALAVSDVFVYLRDEYPHLHDVLNQILPNIDAPGLRLHLRRGAGAYICGEETALIESLEGKRGLPRNRPPYPAQSGYMGRPTITQNVETLYWVAEIWQRGANWYQAEQRPRFYSVSGRVRQPGVYLAPSTALVSELIKAADGMEDGHAFKAFLPGGASGGIFPASMADQAMDFGVFEKLGGFVGSGALTVLSDADDLWDIAQTLSEFFANESCGQCTPCRVGTAKMVDLIQDPIANQALIRELAAVMRDASICGLGQAAANPVLSLLDHFEEDVT